MEALFRNKKEHQCCKFLLLIAQFTKISIILGCLATNHVAENQLMPSLDSPLFNYDTVQVSLSYLL